MKLQNMLQKKWKNHPPVLAEIQEAEVLEAAEPDREVEKLIREVILVREVDLAQEEVAQVREVVPVLEAPVEVETNLAEIAEAEEAEVAQRAEVVQEAETAQEMVQSLVEILDQEKLWIWDFRHIPLRWRERLV